MSARAGAREVESFGERPERRPIDIAGGTSLMSEAEARILVRRIEAAFPGITERLRKEREA